MSKEWTSWGIVLNMPDDLGMLEEVLAVEGVIQGRDLPLFTGTLGEWCERYRHPFVVHRDGRYIQVGVIGL